MVEQMSEQPSPAFIRELRRVLRHLYDPDVLRNSPLRVLLPETRRDSPAELQALLSSAIEALKPASGTSSQSAAYRTYHTLSGRYLQQFSQSEVARGLGVSLRQLRRQDQLALRVLAERLWVSHHLDEWPEAAWTPVAATAAANTKQEHGREQELQWLERSEKPEVIALAELVGGLLRTIAPLAAAAAVELKVWVPEDLPHLLVPAGTLRQALLNLLSAAIHQAAGSRVTLAAKEADNGQLTIHIAPAPPESSEELAMARQLLSLMHGTLTVERDLLSLALPHASRVTVLVIDDNADALELMQRYLAGTSYLFAGTRDPEQGLAMAASLRPCAIVLDIMLPGIDGWDLLGRLRAHPTLLGVPIIVSTILPQQKLALALGAAAFLRKPVGKADLLETLDRFCVNGN